MIKTIRLLAMAVLMGGCAALGLNRLVEAPRFATVPGRVAELQLLGPSLNRPLGGAQVRIWTRVENPNAFEFTLAALRGNLHLEDVQAAEFDLPLGLPLNARGDTIIPIDVNISFADLGGLAGAAQRVLASNRVAYRVDGTVTVDAGSFGRPSFGPNTLLQGETRVIR